MRPQPLGPWPGDVSQTNRPDESSRAQTAAFPLQMLFLDCFFSVQPAVFTKSAGISYSAIRCHCTIEESLQQSKPPFSLKKKKKN